MPIILFFAFSLFAGVAQAITFTLPENALLIATTPAAQGLHKVALGRAREVNQRFHFEQEILVHGEQTQQIWQFDNSVNYQTTVSFVQDKIAQLGLTRAYQCQGRACGASNLWANDYFKNWLLYGPDDKQYYWVLRDDRQYIQLYLIERGNRKVYFLIQTTALQPEESACDAAALSKKITANTAWRLLVSVPNDAEQVASVQLAQECAKQIRLLKPDVQLNALGLGPWDARWKKVDEIKIELQAQ